MALLLPTTLVYVKKVFSIKIVTKFELVRLLSKPERVLNHLSFAPPPLPFRRKAEGHSFRLSVMRGS